MAKTTHGLSSDYQLQVLLTMRDSISIAIPTYGRDQELIDTVQALLDLSNRADEILVVDQTSEHTSGCHRQLDEWASQAQIHWIRRKQPSITQAMNCALQTSQSSLVLFLDDDIVPYPEIVSGHLKCHKDQTQIWASVGQVIQPWQRPDPIAPTRKMRGLQRDFDFPFHSTLASSVENVMAGNLCVRREKAIEIGGFDENYIGSAYRFETDFARRLIAAGGSIYFCPHARIDHLRSPRGGTRQTGSHLTSADPKHGIGDHYYALRHGRGIGRWAYIARRMIREVATKFHLTHPWWIPVKMCGEIRAILGAYQLSRHSPQLMSHQSRTD